MSTVQTKQTNLREKLAELLDFRKMRDRLSGLGLYIGKDRTGTDENLLVRGGANVDDLQIGEIAALVGGTAVDVFVYDTSRDSDGGAWRKRTQHTSWYNEELNTATRGARREFPAVAVIVAEADKVTIYDGDDPDLSMWMVFPNDGWLSYNNVTSGSSTLSSCVAGNSIIVIGAMSTGGLFEFRFLQDISAYVFHDDDRYQPLIANRSDSSIFVNDGPGLYSGYLVNRAVNDVAMTILPNAPIDQNTGLPVPAIAVATDGGVSVIKDDGTVVDLNVLGRPYSSVYFSGNVVWAVENPETDYDLLRYFEIPASDITTTAAAYGPNSSPALFAEHTKGNIFDSFNYGSPIGITKLDHEGSMVAYTTSKYNTGWMPGDIKLATLSDTTVETIGESSDNLLTGDNITFDGGEGDWDGVHAILSVEENRLKVTNSTSTNSGLAYLDVDTVVGARYFLEVSIDIGSSPEVSLQVYNGAEFEDQNTFVNKGTSGTYYLQFNAESSTSRIVLANNSIANGHYSFFDNVSLKQTTELITNGDFSNGTTGWVAKEESSISVAGGKLTAVCTNNYDGVQVDSSYLASLEPNKRYVMSVDIDSISSGTLAFGVIAGATSSEINSPGIYSMTFTVPSTSQIWIDNRTSGASTFVLNSVSIRPAVDDRSVNNNGLQIVGEINKTPVAPGADLVAYSGFNANDYLVQPYNEDLDFGTGDFCIMGWFKGTSTNGTILDRASADASLGRTLMLFSGNLEFKTIFNGNTITCVSNKSISDNVWHYFSAVRRDGKLSIYIDGFLSSTEEDSTDDVSNPSAYLNIGLRYNSSGPLESGNYLALLRVGATAPTAKQIAKIYQDERQLFTDGAQATLYGTSDAVTALAYDEKTELLHVGTASGRSDFSGLRRINNTTTAITTSISAHNNLIAEQ